MQTHLDDAVANGARVLAGGKRREDLGPFFFEPTVLADVTDAAACFRQETFGPLVAIYPVDSVDEGHQGGQRHRVRPQRQRVRRQQQRTNAIADQLRAGTVNINESYAAAGAPPPRRWMAWAPRASVSATATKAC